MVPPCSELGVVGSAPVALPAHLKLNKPVGVGERGTGLSETNVLELHLPAHAEVPVPAVRASLQVGFGKLRDPCRRKCFCKNVSKTVCGVLNARAVHGNYLTGLVLLSQVTGGTLK